MRWAVYFNVFITDESVTDLISNLEKLPEVDLFINSGGGEMIATYILVHFLNIHPNISLYMIGDIGSSITHILLDFKGYIVLTKELESITFHAIDRPTYLIRSAKESKASKATVMADNKRYYKKLINQFKFTNAEINKIKRGDNIIFYRNDFIRIAQVPNIWIS